MILEGFFFSGSFWVLDMPSSDHPLRMCVLHHHSHHSVSRPNVCHLFKSDNQIMHIWLPRTSRSLLLCHYVLGHVAFFNEIRRLFLLFRHRLDLGIAAIGVVLQFGTPSKEIRFYWLWISDLQYSRFGYSTTGVFCHLIYCFQLVSSI